MIFLITNFIYISKKYFLNTSLMYFPPILFYIDVTKRRTNTGEDVWIKRGGGN